MLMNFNVIVLKTVTVYHHFFYDASIKEKCKALKHIAGASILLMESLGGKDDE